MKEVKKNKEEGKVQILLFSATFDEAVKKYANEVVGGKANQVRSCTMLHPCSCLFEACLSVQVIPLHHFVMLSEHLQCNKRQWFWVAQRTYLIEVEAGEDV